MHNSIIHRFHEPSMSNFSNWQNADMVFATQLDLPALHNNDLRTLVKIFSIVIQKTLI